MRDKPIKTMRTRDWTAKTSLLLVFTLAIFLHQGRVGPNEAQADTLNRVPTSDITRTWSTSTGTATIHWEDVDDPVGSPDNNTTNINTTVTGYDLFGFSAFTVPGGSTITNVSVTIVGADATSGNNRMFASLRVNGVNYDNATNYNPTALQPAYDAPQTFSWATNPNTLAAWTVADINGTGANPLQGFGVDATDAVPGLYVTQVYITVTYTPPAVPPTVVSGPTASNIESGIFVDSPFDITARFNDNGSVISTCEYSLNNGGSWTGATKSGSGAATDCSASPTCTNGTALTILIRATNGGGTTTTGSLLRTCDAVGPVSGASFTATPGNTTCTLNWATTTDAGAGMHATEPYEIRWQEGSDPGSCTGGAQLYIGTGTNTPHNSLTNGNTYYYRLCYKDVFIYQSQYTGNPVTCTPVSGPPTLNPDSIPANTNWSNYTAPLTPLNPTWISDVNDATYFTTVTNGATFDAGFSNDAAYIGKQIDNVRISVRAYAAGEKIDWGPVIGGTPYLSGTQVTLTTTPTDYFKDWATNPATAGNWTPADVDALVARMSAIATGGMSEERVYKVWVEVSFSEPPSSGGLLHNSTTTGSTKWSGAWGVAGGRYGEIVCETCHIKSTGDIKRIKDTVIAAPNTPTNRFPAEIGGVAPVFTRVSGNPGDAGVMGDDSDTSPSGRTSSSRICEVCHTYDSGGTNGVKVHPYNSLGAVINLPTHQNNAKDCMGCHKHSQGFKVPLCDTCHGNPPTAASLGGPTGLANSPNTTGSTTPGSHSTHAVTLLYGCGNCHNNQNMPQTSIVKPGFGDISISFSNFGSTTGSYTGQSNVSYNNTLGSGTMTCSTVYCHSAGQNSTGGALTAGDYSAPQWGTAATGDCGTCHKVSEAAGLTSGGHAAHLGTPGVTGCSNCHTDAADDGSSYVSVNHVNRLIDATGTYDAGGTVGNGYGRCSTASCHANVYAAGTITTPTWGNTSNCTACHTVTIDATGPATGSHVVHSDTTCTDCHNAGTTQTTPPTTAHIDGTIDVTDGYPANVTKHTSGTYSGRCSTATCHANVYGSGTVTTPTWGVATDCRACHTVAIAATGPATGSHVVHNDTTCTDCHNAGTTQTTPPSTAHRDGTIDVTDGYPANVTKHTAGTYSGRCSTASCHVNVYGTGTTTTPTWGVTADCTACHSIAIATTGPATGSHVAHGDTTCTDCHNAGTTQTTPPSTAHRDGNIDVTDGYTANVTKHASGTYSGRCSTASCHVNVYGTGSTTSPTWGVVTGCTACHSVAIASTGPATGSHVMHGYTTCTYCHNAGTTQTTSPSTGHTDGNIDVTAGYPANVTKHTSGTYSGTCANNNCHGVNSTVWGASSGAATCVKCHGITTSTPANYTADTKRAAPGYTAASAPVGPGVDTAGQTGTVTNNVSNDTEVGAHDTHLRARTGISSPIACAECHANVNTTSVTFTNHMNGAPSLDFGTALAKFNGAPGNYDPATHTCSNIYCHDETYFTKTNHTNGGSDRSPTWNDTAYFGDVTPPLSATECGRCHFYQAGLDCSSCHGAVVNADDYSIADVTKHVNGSVESSGGTCTGCHANQTGSSPLRRIITGASGEFGLTYGHKKSGRGAVTDADCYPCHWEAQSNGTVNTTYHSATAGDGIVDLRTDAGGRVTVTQFSRNLNNATLEATATNVQTHCLACHDSDGAPAWVSGGSATNPWATGQAPVNVEGQLAATNTSFHPVLGVQNNSWAVGTVNMQSPWNVTTHKLITCFDCHVADGATGTVTSTPASHGGATNLRGVVTGQGAVATPLCVKCHTSTVYWGAKVHNATNTTSAMRGISSARHDATDHYGCTECHGVGANPGFGATALQADRAIDAHGFNAAGRYLFIRTNFVHSPSTKECITDMCGTGYVPQVYTGSF